MSFYRTIWNGCPKSDVRTLFTSNFQLPASNIRPVNQNSTLLTKIVVELSK